MHTSIPPCLSTMIDKSHQIKEATCLPASNRHLFLHIKHSDFSPPIHSLSGNILCPSQTFRPFTVEVLLTDKTRAESAVGRYKEEHISTPSLSLLSFSFLSGAEIPSTEVHPKYSFAVSYIIRLFLFYPYSFLLFVYICIKRLVQVPLLAV